MANEIYAVENYEVNDNFIKSNGFSQKNVTSLAKEFSFNCLFGTSYNL